MSFPTPPGGRGRHTGPDGAGQSLSAWAAGLPRQQAPVRPDPETTVGPAPAAPPRRRAGVIDREHAPDFPIAEYARHSSPDDDRTGRMPGLGDAPADPPPPPGTQAGPPLPPRPAGTWSRLQRRGDVPPDEEATVAQPAVGSAVPPPPAGGSAGHPHTSPRPGPDRPDPRTTGAPAPDAHDAHGDHLPGDHEPGGHDGADHDDDATGGLEVIGDDGHPDDGHPDDGHPDDEHADDGYAVSGPRRRRRRPLAVVLSLVVLAALVGGIVYGGKALIDLVNPAAEDYAGAGTGSVQVRVSDGDTLSDIGRTLVDADVIASVRPFVTAAESRPAARGIQPGVYGLRQQMSGEAALDLLLDPASRLFSRVTIPEGFTVTRVLERLAEETDTPVEELNAAAVDPAATGLPAYANGLLEGWLFPATYDFEPETTAAQMLATMVSRTVQTLDRLGVPEDQRLTVLTKASLVQAEAALPEDMGMVARVLENRLGIGMALQLDSTVNYATGNTGITTTAEDRANPSPYNTYYAPGLPPGAIGNPGEQAINAVLDPTPGPWIYFVTVNPTTGETRFGTTAEEHAANVALFRQWLAENPD
ncbi:endolytic transglycosylase MltG [Trujillonella humicola]|uniref:endolytic transglycosylase MltG n=1 Tax=Trujillonella humicola TaxID=3383699 RepID=UPI003906ABC0